MSAMDAAPTKDLSRWALLSIATALVTIALKTTAWQITGSVGLLSDAAESLVNLVAATQDIATDGLTVRILPERWRGLGNSLQVGGYKVGMIVSGAGLLLVIDALGWPMLELQKLAQPGAACNSTNKGLQ